MLGLVLSTIAFFVAAYVLNRQLDDQGIDKNFSRKLLVGTVATLISFGTGWAIDKLTGAEDTPQKSVSITDIMQGGDPTQALKALSGIK
jgi:hypothetical protein